MKLSTYLMETTRMEYEWQGVIHETYLCFLQGVVESYLTHDKRLTWSEVGTLLASRTNAAIISEMRLSGYIGELEVDDADLDIVLHQLRNAVN